MTIGLLVIGILLGVVAAVVPMDALVRKLVVAIAVIVLVLAILGLFGLLPISTGGHVVERRVIVP